MRYVHKPVYVAGEIPSLTCPFCGKKMTYVEDEDMWCKDDHFVCNDCEVRIVVYDGNMDNPCSCKSVIIENTERNFTVQTNSIDKKLRPYINFIYEIDFDGDLRYDGAFSTKLSLDTPVEELLEKCARIFSMFEKYGKLVQPEYLDEQFEFCCADAEQVHDLSNGNGNRIKDVHCKVLSADEFRALLYEMYGSSVYTDFSADGLYVGRTEADIPVEDLHERLAEKLNVCEVTSIHIDDSEPTGVWISVITTAMDM